MSVDPLARLAPWRRTAVVAALVPLLLAVVLSAFAWTAARSAPRDLPIGVVATGPAEGRLAAGLQTDGFDVHVFAGRGDATRAITHRDVYAALVVQDGRTTVLTASAASPAVATQFASNAARLSPGPVRVVDVVPLSNADPRGAVLASAALPLVFGGMIVALLVTSVLRLRTHWATCLALMIVSATTATAAWVVVQGWLGALPGDHLFTATAIMLTVLAISSTVAGLYALIGTAGIGLGAVTMLFVGNPFSGITSAPELLPTAVDRIGRWMPPGAGANLLRSTAYFHGHGAGGHLAVLLCWAVFGMVAVVVGHERRARKQRRTVAEQAVARPGRHEVGAGRIPARELTAAPAGN